MGDFSQLSVRSVFCAIWARPGEKTPVARRLAVGALICRDSLRVNCSEDYPFQCPGLKPGRGVIWPTGREFAAGESAPEVPAHTLVVDVPPELAVVRGVRNGDLFAGSDDGVGCVFEFDGIHLENLEVADDPFGVDDDAAHGWVVCRTGAATRSRTVGGCL